MTGADKFGDGADREPGEGESWDGRGGIRPVPAGVDPAPEQRDAPCPDCDHGRVTVSDDLHATCDNCDAVVFRKEVGL